MRRFLPQGGWAAQDAISQWMEGELWTLRRRLHEERALWRRCRFGKDRRRHWRGMASRDEARQEAIMNEAMNPPPPPPRR